MIKAQSLRRILGRKTSLLVVLVLALGMGASLAFFSMADAVLFHAVRSKDLGRLVVIGGASAPPGSNDRISWWAQSPSLEALMTYELGWGTLRWNGRSGPVMATVASPQFFRVFDIQPVLGRGFQASDQGPGATGVAVLNNRLWTEAFERSINVLGTEVVLDGTPFQVVGVMPEGFDFPGQTDLWVAQQLSTGEANDQSEVTLGRNGRTDSPSKHLQMSLIGRLGQDATVANARADVSLLDARMRHQFGEVAARNNMGFGDPPTVQEFRTAISQTSRPTVILLFGSSLFLLIVACLNAGNLLVAESVAHHRETAIRRCLGATSWRITEQMIAESVGLSLLGAILGVALAWWGVGFLRSIGTVEIVGLTKVQILPVTVAFAFVLIVATGVASGIAPALHARRVEPGRWLSGEGHVLSSHLASHTRKIFAGGQIALAFVLIVGAVVTAKTFYQLLEKNPGFDPSGVMALNLVPMQTERGSQAKMQEATSSQIQPKEALNGLSVGLKSPTAAGSQQNKARPKFESDSNQELVENLSAVPGVTSVGLVDSLPFGGQLSRWKYIDVSGKISVAKAQAFTVAGDYFGTLKVPLLAGRFFKDADGNGSTVIIDQTLSSMIWGNESPVGRLLRVEGEDNFRQVIGVVGDVKFSSLAAPSMRAGSSQIYFKGHLGAMAVVVRTRSSSENLLPELDRAIELAVPGAAVYRAATMQNLIGESMEELRFRGVLLGFFAFAALLLGLLGVYGVASFAASIRTKEFAVRIALGSRPGEIVGLAVRDIAVFIVAGIAVGVGLTFAISKALTLLLLGVATSDAKTMTESALALSAMALVAGLTPVLRASRIHPAQLLRYE